jgi:glycosyltransferase involved in cell wall biosynthesis
MTRIAVLNTHPIQYFAPLYRYLNQQEGITVEALYFSDCSLKGAMDKDFGVDIRWDVDLTSGYTHHFVGGAEGHRTPGDFWSVYSPKVWKHIDKSRYDALWVHGHGYAGFLIAMLAARLKGIPILMRGETHLGLPMPKWRKVLRTLMMKPFYSQCARLLAISTRNRAFYRSLGVPESKIFMVPYAVDNDRFVDAADDARSERLAIRAQFGIEPDVPLILYASKFQRRKRPDDLIAAVGKLAALGANAHLLMIGSGEMDAELRAQVAALGLSNVTFGGFANQNALPGIYAASDVFVLPSEIEPFGLIVNEVMCAGLPVVATDALGCAPDLVKHGETGLLYSAGDVDALADALKALVCDPERRRKMGQAGKVLISQWSFRQVYEGLMAATAGIK